MIGGLGNDSYFVDDEADKVVENVGEGHDTLHTNVDVVRLQDGIEDLRLYGARIGFGNDSDNLIVVSSGHNGCLLVGEGGDDFLVGGEAADTLRGGDGGDTLIGGTGGADRFEFDHADTGFDTILDFVAGTDKIVLSGFHLSELVAGVSFVVNTGPTTNADTILYNTGTGVLSYDADGTGAEAATQIALLLNTRPTLTVSDFILI